METDKKRAYLFHQGTYYRSYEFFGCHFLGGAFPPESPPVMNFSVGGTNNGAFPPAPPLSVATHEKNPPNNSNGAFPPESPPRREFGPAIFRVWAPNARGVSLVGDFNGWNPKTHPMKKSFSDGIWEVSVDCVFQYQKYKYEITTPDNKKILKSDPYATFNETDGGTASMVFDIEGFEWHDAEFMRGKKDKNIYESPINIYEVNFSSWKRRPDGSAYTYRMLAEELVDYCADMGYTHIEIMPITEYPFEGSWGYQCTGFFSVTSRFGSPHDFMYFVDRAHQKGLGVILDWVPSHFPKDAFGLIDFDGRALFEHPRWDRIEHKSWGTRRFDYGRTEVQSFLVSSAMMFLEYYHIDGLRVDAVASMLYLDYDKKSGEWIPNDFGDNRNLEAVAFLQKLNTAVFSAFPDTLMIAEESTAWPMVTKPVNSGGLGFNFKWNMGWMNDVTEYIKIDPWFRRDHHSKMTFSMVYAFSENFMLPISHDEVVHGKGSLINKMFGDYDQKFEGLRTFLAYMYAHPGKKLLFMGSEIAQFDEWDNNLAVQFDLLGFDRHLETKNFVRALNLFYLNRPELFQRDFDWEGFKWLSVDDKSSNLLAFSRKSNDGSELVCVFNFSLAPRNGYRLRVSPGLYEEVFSTKPDKREKMRTKTLGGESILRVDLAPQSAIFLAKTINEWTI